MVTRELLVTVLLFVTGPLLVVGPLLVTVLLVTSGAFIVVVLFRLVGPLKVEVVAILVVNVGPLNTTSPVALRSFTVGVPPKLLGPVVVVRLVNVGWLP